MMCSLGTTMNERSGEGSDRRPTLWSVLGQLLERALLGQTMTTTVGYAFRLYPATVYSTHFGYICSWTTQAFETRSQEGSDWELEEAVELLCPRNILDSWLLLVLVRSFLFIPSPLLYERVESFLGTVIKLIFSWILVLQLTSWLG